MGIGGTPDTFRLDAGVEGPGKIGVLHEPCRLAGVVFQALAFAGGLDAAFVHSENEGPGAVVFEGLAVDPAIDPEIEGLLETIEAARQFGTQEPPNGPGFEG